MKTKYFTLKLGIKNGITDGLLIALPPDSKSSIITTINKFAAAPVQISKESIKKFEPKYIFINSGNANACTGKKGYENAKYIQKLLCERLSCNQNEILLMSTGIIGKQLPMNKIISSITNVAFTKSTSLKNAATAIMTTDKYPKYQTKSYIINDKRITFTGICKGAGMIEPSMATMLAFIQTDICLNKNDVKKYNQYFSDSSFNSISVDGDMSTNDTVVFSSTNKIPIDLSNKRNLNKFISCGAEFFISMASKIVTDGEGSTKIIELNIKNCNSKKLAVDISKKISNSLLVKTAMFGSDPNWGRIIASLGSIESKSLDTENIKLYINDILIFSKGLPHNQVTSKLKKSMKKKKISITVDLSSGKKEHKLYFSDLSYEYVKINSEYTT